MGPSDLDGVMAIEEVSFPTPWSREMFIEDFPRDFSDTLVAAGVDDEVLGYAVCWILAGESHLLNIAVHPGRRGRGIGRALLSECIGRAARAGASLIFLEVRAGIARWGSPSGGSERGIIPTRERTRSSSTGRYGKAMPHGSPGLHFSPGFVARGWRRVWIQGARPEGPGDVVETTLRSPTERNAVDMPVSAAVVEGW